MRLFKLLMTVGILCEAWGMQVFALENLALKDRLPPGSYSLIDIINEKNSEAFACHFGSFRVAMKEKKGSDMLATIQGTGFLVNSRFLTPNIGSNKDITYRFAANTTIVDGSRLSVFCNGFGKNPNETTVTYFIRERN